MKFPKTQGLVALLCVLAAPLSHATSTSLTVGYSQLSLQAFSTPSSTTPVAWLGYGAGAFTTLTPGNSALSALSSATVTASGLAAVAASGSGDLAKISSTDTFALTVTAGTIYKLSLPYSYTIDATDANDGAASLSLSLALVGGTSSATLLKGGGVGDAYTGAGTLSYLFKAAQTGTVNVKLSSLVSSGAALSPLTVTPVPEAGAGSMALAGLGVAALMVMRRRRQA